MLSSVFGKSFNLGKCKTLLRLAISRIKLLRNKRDMQLKQMRRELGQLLQAKQELTARIRVEHVFREQNIMAAYEIIELFSELLVVRLPIIESQRQCPIDLREAIASLIFAAPRCADLPELQQISSLFAVKYGKDFVAAAVELRPDCGVNRLVIEKLSVRAPSGEVRLKLMKEIAEEQGVDWDAAALESEFQKTPEDLLDGPNRFMGATVHFQEPIIESNSNVTSDFCFQNKAREDDSQSIPFTLPDPPSGSQSQSTSTKSPSAEQNAQELGAYELAREEGYKAAADAARAAALSAERAAAAAVAVASLATENFARMHSDISKRRTSESSSASDDDDYRKDSVMQRGSPTRVHTNDYFKIRMDSFDAHLDIPKPESLDDIGTTVKPLFDEYPEEEVRYTNADRGAGRKPVDVEDYTSEEDQSDSTERSDSPPLHRRCNFKDNHATDQGIRRAQPFDSFKHNVRGSSRRPHHAAADPHGNGFHHDHQSIKVPPQFDADKNNPHPSSRAAMRHENGLHYEEYERQQPGKSRGFSVQRGDRTGPPERSPPNLPRDVQVTTHTASHVHPKLPNYDDLAARFEALRSRN